MKALIVILVMCAGLSSAYTQTLQPVEATKADYTALQQIAAGKPQRQLDMCPSQAQTMRAKAKAGWRLEPLTVHTVGGVTLRGVWFTKNHRLTGAFIIRIDLVTKPSGKTLRKAWLEFPAG